MHNSSAPFPGLHAFEPGQTDFFFGRDEEVRQLIVKLRMQRLVGVVGVSGIGKSSLVRAGLIPRLDQGYMTEAGTRWRTVMLKPGQAPLKELARKLSQCFGLMESEVADALHRSSRGLLRLAADHLAPDENLLILVDQFEELIRFSADADPQRGEAAEFVDLILGATGHGPLEPAGEKKPPVFVLLTMRSEFLGKCTRFPGLAEALNDGQFLVPRLERGQLKLAIEGPVAMVGARIAPSLAQDLLNDTANEVDQLPLMQFALARMWEVSAGDRSKGEALDSRHYQAVGGSIVTALNRAANGVVDTLTAQNPRNADIIRRLFQRLAEPGATDEEVRRPARMSELAAVTECPVSDLKPLVGELERHGFLTMSADDDAEIGITHESLIRRWEKLNFWVKEEAASADVYRRLAGAAARGGSPYSGPDLNEALRWRKAHHPSAPWAKRYPVANASFEQAMAFLQTSRRRWWLFRGVGAVAAVAVVIALFDFYSSIQEAQRRLKTVAVDRLSLLAQNLGNGPSHLAQKSLLFGLEALKIQPSADVDSFVREQWSNVPIFQARMRYEGGGDRVITGLEFTPDAKFLISASEDKTLRLWDASSGQQLSKVTLDRQVRRIQYDPGSGYIATLSYDVPSSLSAITLWKIQEASLTGPLFRHQFAHASIAFMFGDGKLWMADDASLLNLNLASISSGAQSIELKSAPPTFTKDGKYLLSAPPIFTPDGKYLLSVDGEIVNARNLTTGVTASFEFPEPLEGRNVDSILISPDSQFVGLVGAVKNPDRTVSYRFYQWRLDPLTKVGNGLTLSRRSKEARSPGSKFVATAEGTKRALSPGGKFVATAEISVTPSPELRRRPGATVIDTTSGNQAGGMAEKETGLSGQFGSITQFSHDSTRIALAAAGTAVRIFTLRPWREVFRIGVAQINTAFAWSRDDTTVAVGTENGLVTVWRLVADEESDRILARNFAYSPSGRYSVRELDETHAVLDAGNTTLQHFEDDTLPNYPFSASYAFSADERHFAWIDRRASRISLYSLPEGRFVCPVKYPGKIVKAAFRHSDVVMAVLDDGTLRSWSAENCRSMPELSLGQFQKGKNEDTAFDWQVYFSPQGNRVAINLKDDVESMTLWDLDARKKVGAIPAMTSWGITFSPDESLASGITKDGVTVWRSTSAQELWHQPVDSSDWYPKFDRTGRKLAGGAGHVARVWDSESGKTLLEDNDESAVVSDVSFDRSGEFIASAWSGGRIKIWKIGGGVQTGDVPINSGGDIHIQFTSDNSKILVKDDATADVFTAFWWRPDDVVREGCRHVAFNLSPQDLSRRLGGDYTLSKLTCPGLPVLEEETTTPDRRPPLHTP